MTLLFTSAVADEPLAVAAPLFLDNEFGREDVNKSAALAESADPVGPLDRATRGHRPASARYREIMGPLGLGDELRAALIAGKQCWGVLCLHRENASHGFDGWEVDLIRRVSPRGRGAAAGRHHRAGCGRYSGDRSSGIIVLDQDLAVMSMTPEAGDWLAELREADWPRKRAARSRLRCGRPAGPA